MQHSAASRSAGLTSTSGVHHWTKSGALFGLRSEVRDSRLNWKLAASVLGDKAPTSGDKARISAGTLSALEVQRQEDQQMLVNAAFPSYLQNSVDDFCAAWDDAIQEAQRKQSSSQGQRGVTKNNPVWQAIRKECQKDVAEEPLLSSFLYASILSHDTFERSLAFVLANRLADTTLLPTELFEMFHAVLREHEDVTQAALADIIAFRERDPACTAYGVALLYYKGYHAVQAARIAHVLWNRGQKLMALMLQARISAVLAIDIHPAAQIGKGLLLDHGTGVVIGETAVIGNNVSMMQNVTLGGTGKDSGDRHPKIEDNVLIGAGAKILGAITVGRGSQVAAGSLVLKPVQPRTMVAGSPATQVGKVSGNPALKMQHWQSTQRGAGPAAPSAGPAPSPPPDAAAQQAHSQPSSPPPPTISAPQAFAGNGLGKLASHATEHLKPAATLSKASQPASSLAQGVHKPKAGSSLSLSRQHSNGKTHRAHAHVEHTQQPAAKEKELPQRQAHIQELVEAVTNDRLADMKWPEKPDPEYII